MLNKIGLRQLPCERPVVVVRVLVEPKGDIKCKVLCEKRREIKLVKESGRFSAIRWEIKRGMLTVS